MDLGAVFLVAVALGVDALAVATAIGVSLGRISGRQLFRLGFHFGLFQAMMPVLGWLAGGAVAGFVGEIDHWVAFSLLAFVAGKMGWEAFGHEQERRTDADPTRGWTLILLSVGTSIDALAVGLSLSVLGLPIAFPALVIGIVCAVMTVGGMLVGSRIGLRFPLARFANILGALILLGIGIRILFEHGAW
ncbi:MAG: manganese efflux pump [Deltaproteobacteria bacterium]|nr:manganese efflux pump [Deltaproteobacteria bacterium]